MKELALKLIVVLAMPILISGTFPDTPEPPVGGDGSDQNQCFVASDDQTSHLVDIQLNGISELTSAIMRSTPSTLQGMKFEMGLEGSDEYDLTLFPKSAFEVSSIYSNYFLVEVINASALYISEGGIYFPRYEKIEYRISLANQAPIPQCTDSFQKCLISVSFLYNSQLLDFERLSGAFEFDFIYNEQALELINISGSEVQFRRKSNMEATVKAKLISKTSERVIQIESKPLAKCKQAQTGHPGDDGDRPTRPNRPTRPGSGHGHDHDHDHDHDGGSHHQRPEIDQRWMRYKSTRVDILNRDDRLLSRGFTAYYRVVVANPYPADIECDITLVSSRGTNRSYEIIDTKVHRALRIPANSSATEHGQIEGKEGHGTNGLLWTTNYGHEVSASGCRYLN